jgi:hypothetical protein
MVDILQAFFLFLILWKVVDMSQLMDDVVAELATANSKLVAVADAVNALEALITGLKDPAEAAKLQAVLDGLKALNAGADAVVADAVDGVDEAVPPAP